MKTKQPAKQTRWLLWGVVGVIVMLLVGLFYVSDGFPVLFLGVWVGVLALCAVPVVMLSLPLIVMWDLWSTRSLDKQKRTLHEDVTKQYRLGDDGEIIEIADDQELKRGGDSAVQ